MRIILIAIAALSLLGFLGTKIYRHFTGYTDPKKIEERKKPLEELEQKEALAHAVPETPSGALPADITQTIQSTVPESSQIGSYRFKHRIAPTAPNFLRGEGAKVLVETDVQSNSWIWMGSLLYNDQITSLAKSFDTRQVELDLEFVLVLISTDKLKAAGVSVFYEQGSSFLDVLNLQGDAGSLRISSGSWGLDIDYSNSKSGVALLSQPVIRCLDGNDWKFGNDTQVPIPRSEFVDGVLRQVIEYRPIGFGLEGNVRILDQRILLKVKQRNGAVTPGSSSATNEAPIFQDQILETTLELAFGEWSILGGIQVDKELTKKGLFRSSLQVTSDYLVIFARPRLSLEAAPKAFPVDLRSDSPHPLESVPDGLLPPKGWLPEK